MSIDQLVKMAERMRLDALYKGKQKIILKSIMHP